MARGTFKPSTILAPGFGRELIKNIPFYKALFNEQSRDLHSAKELHVQDLRPMHNECHSHLVLMSAFLCLFTVGGVSNGSSRMLVALIDTFRATRAEAGLILSIMMAFRGFAGLFSGMLVQRFGARVTCFAGSLVLSASFGVSFFATSVPFLVVTLGICAGTGLASMFVTCTPTLCEHFKGRPLIHAITFMTTGTSVGGMAYSYMIGYLIQQYGVRGTCLIIGGLIMNTSAMTLLWNRRPNPNKINRSKPGSRCVSEHPPIQQLHAKKEIDSTESFPTNAAEKRSVKQHVSQHDSERSVSFKAVGNAPITQHTSRDLDTATSVSINTIGKQQIQKTLGSGSLKPLKESLKSVFTNKIFMLFAFGESLHLAVLYNARTYIVDTINVGPMLIEDRQFEYGSLAVFLFCLFSLFGQFLFAIIKQTSRCSSLDVSLMSTAFGITGSLLIAFVRSVTMRLIAWCLLGVAFGIYSTLRSVATAKLLERQHVAIGLGIVMFIRAICSTVGGPLNGYIRDVTGTYTVVFICASVLLVLGGVLVSIARFNRLKRRRACSFDQTITIRPKK